MFKFLQPVALGRSLLGQKKLSLSWSEEQVEVDLEGVERQARLAEAAAEEVRELFAAVLQMPLVLGQLKQLPLAQEEQAEQIGQTIQTARTEQMEVTVVSDQLSQHPTD